jgi:hypothetical protein
VAHHGGFIARQLLLDHDSWCGIKILHPVEGAFHATWVGPFAEGNGEGGEEWTVRTLLEQRGLNNHARIFRAPFAEEEEAWDYVFDRPPEEAADR